MILNNRQKRLFKDIISPDGVEMLIVEFESRLFMSQFQGLFASPKEGNVYKISGRDEIKNIFLEIEREEQLRQLHYQRIQKAKVVEMLSMIARVLQIQDLDGIKVTDEMKRIFTYIDENFKDKISLKEAADMLHMSETAFSKHFSKCTGMGFIQYVTQLRISYSIELLRTTQMSVLDIALECGYNNTSSFYQAFKKITHVTPSDYRNENEVMYI